VLDLPFLGDSRRKSHDLGEGFRSVGNNRFNSAHQNRKTRRGRADLRTHLRGHAFDESLGGELQEHLGLCTTHRGSPYEEIVNGVPIFK
jgi:hypothetical protein